MAADTHPKHFRRWTTLVPLILGTLVFIAPFIWLVLTSLMPLEETMSGKWMPSHLRWDNYGDAIARMRYFWIYARNSLFLCAMTVAGTVASSTLAAYGFSRIEWKGRDKVFTVLLSTMMIPFPVIMISSFILFKHLGWIGTFRPLWAPAFMAGAFNVFLLRQFFLTLPKDISEAARIDGCSDLQIFLRIILPLSKPAVLVVALFQFMATWNDFLAPLIYLTRQKSFTLALGLQSFESQQGGTPWNQLMAATTLVVLPVMVLFFLTQKTFIQGITTTGSKH
ncbi:MAG TPA: carbohydrate ABC transporter permease [Chthoniobacteraceae bacterium]|nr:carbohydrate ABC transporter permease [Chthoniobacteraceae bacterium]